MPEKSYEYPFGQPRCYETLTLLSEEQLKELLTNSLAGISIEIILSNVGAGYLFHVKKVGNDAYQLYSYKGEIFPTELNLAALTRFINHSSGLRFDHEAWLLSGEINRKIDISDGENGNGDIDEDEDESGA